MSIRSDFEYRQQLEHSDNPYQAVRKLAAQARELADEYDNNIFHSQAITHVLHGTKPSMKDQYRDEREAWGIRDFFCNIEDREVRDAVYDSYYDSKEKGNLIYVYNDITEECRRARVRILTRMLWQKLKL